MAWGLFSMVRDVLATVVVSAPSLRRVADSAERFAKPSVI